MLGTMLTLYGVPVTAEDARHIVATLILDGSPDALAAAEMINKGVDRDLYAVALTPAMRDAVLSVLESARRAREPSRRASTRPSRPDVAIL